MSGAALGPLSPVADALSVAILNGLWQGLVIGLVTAGTLAAMSRCSARARYAVACMALALMFIAFAVSFGIALGDALRVASPASRGGHAALTASKRSALHRRRSTGGRPFSAGSH